MTVVLINAYKVLKPLTTILEYNVQKRKKLCLFSIENLNKRFGWGNGAKILSFESPERNNFFSMFFTYMFLLMY